VATHLPPDNRSGVPYYLLNFERALAWLAERYDDLLDEREHGFLRDFAVLPQPSRALLVRMLMRKGALFRVSRLAYDEIGVGVYAKAKRSVLSGAPIPVQPVEILAEQALTRLGVKVYPSKQAELYNAGETTQLPPGAVINTGNRRIVRKLGFGKKTVQYENNFGRAERPH